MTQAREQDDGYCGNRGGALPPIFHTKWGLFPITVLVFSIVFLVSSMIPVESDLAKSIVESLKESMSLSPSDIFIHNLLLSLVMMIPVFGFIFSLFSSSLSGMAVSAFSTVFGSNPLRVAISLISTPEGILEFIAYGLASAQGLAGFFAIVEKRFRNELKEYLLTTIMLIVILFIAALLESARVTGSL